MERDIIPQTYQKEPEKVYLPPEEPYHQFNSQRPHPEQRESYPRTL